MRFRRHDSGDRKPDPENTELPGEGLIVRLGDLGSFYLSIEAEGSPTPEAVNRYKIKRNKLNFRVRVPSHLEQITQEGRFRALLVLFIPSPTV